MLPHSDGLILGSKSKDNIPFADIFAIPNLLSVNNLTLVENSIKHIISSSVYIKYAITLLRILEEGTIFFEKPLSS